MKKQQPIDLLAAKILSAAGVIQSLEPEGIRLNYLHDLYEELWKTLGESIANQWTLGNLPDQVNEVLQPVIRADVWTKAARGYAVMAELGNHVMPYDIESPVTVRQRNFVLNEAEREMNRRLRFAEYRDEIADRTRAIGEWFQSISEPDPQLGNQEVDAGDGGSGQWGDDPPIDHVTLRQSATILHRSKKTLENWKKQDPDFPRPQVIGGNGKPDEWSWAVMRPYLEKKARRALPVTFPSHVQK